MDEKNISLSPALEEKLDELYRAELPEAVSKAALKKTMQALKEVLPITVYYDQLLVSILGPIWVAVSDEGVIAVDWDVTEDEFLTRIAKKTRATFKHDAAKTQKAMQIIAKYLNGKIDTLDLMIDKKMITEFQYKVLMAAREIPRGQIATYGEIAKLIGKPKASRAVGQALRRNPIPIVLPCHRVVAADGTLGGYAGEMGSQKKVRLLKLEGVMLT